jgi:hypothetical protein
LCEVIQQILTTLGNLFQTNTIFFSLSFAVLTFSQSADDAFICIKILTSKRVQNIILRYKYFGICSISEKKGLLNRNCGVVCIVFTWHTVDWQVLTLHWLLRNDKWFLYLLTANDKCFLYIAYSGMASVFSILPIAEWQRFSIPCLLPNGKFCLFLAYCGMTIVFCTLIIAEWQVFSILCLLRNDKFSMFLAYCGMTSVFYTLSTAVCKVVSIPCLMRTDMCFLYFTYCGMTSFLCFLPTAEWQVFYVYCLLRNDKCFMYLAYCGMTSVFYTLPTAECKVVSIPCLMWNDKCFLYLAKCGMTSLCLSIACCRKTSLVHTLMTYCRNVYYFKECEYLNSIIIWDEKFCLYIGYSPQDLVTFQETRVWYKI